MSKHGDNYALKYYFNKTKKKYIQKNRTFFSKATFNKKKFFLTILFALFQIFNPNLLLFNNISAIKKN